MKKLLFVVLALLLCATVVQAFEGKTPKTLGKGSWYVVKGQVVLQEDLQFVEVPIEVQTLAPPGLGTRYDFQPDGNFYCAYNAGWDYYICGALDGSGFYCRYYEDKRICLVGSELVGIYNN